MSLKRAAMHSMLWTGVAQVVGQGTAFIITVILARLLSPQNFGLVAMSMTVIAVGQVLQDAGLGTALVQKPKVDDDDLCSVFWVSIMIGAVLASVVYLSAPLVSRIYHEPRIIPILRVLSSIFVIGTLLPVQATILTRNLNFKALAIRQMSGIFIGGMVGFIMALRGFGAWSLVGQSLSTTVVSVIVVWWASTWRPRLLIKPDRIRQIWGYGVRVTATSFLRSLMRVSDRSLIGQKLGAGALGYYQLASNWMMLPQVVTFEVIGRVAFPILSRVGDDIGKIKEAFIWTTKLVALIIIPLMTAIAIIAPEMVVVVYGPKWSRSIILVQLLAIVGARQTIIVMNSPVLQAMARVDIQLWWEGLSLATMVGAILVGLPYGLHAATSFYAVISVLTLPILAHQLCRLMRIGTVELLSVLLPAAKVTGVMAVAMILVRLGTLAAGLTNGFVLISTIVVGVATALLAMRLAARDEVGGLISLFNIAFRGGKSDEKSAFDQ